MELPESRSLDGKFTHVVQTLSRPNYLGKGQGKTLKKVYQLVKEFFGPSAYPTKEGSVEKATGTFFSDADILIHTPHVISDEEWRGFFAHIQKKPTNFGKDATFTRGRVAITLKPPRCPYIDLVPANSTFGGRRERASTAFYNNQIAQTAVRATKLWLGFLVDKYEDDPRHVHFEIKGSDIEVLILVRQLLPAHSHSSSLDLFLYALQRISEGSVEGAGYEATKCARVARQHFDEHRKEMENAEGVIRSWLKSKYIKATPPEQYFF